MKRAPTASPRAYVDRPAQAARRWRPRATRVITALLLVVGVRLPATSFATYPIGKYLLPVNDIPQGLHAGDCTGDGLPDVIVADQGSQDLTILRNVDSNHLAFFTSIAATARPRGAVCADFNNDGLPDVAAIDRDAGIAVIYLQKATGGFQKTVTFAVAKLPNSIQAADLDHDGNMDFVVISTGQRIMSIRFGDGTGAFPRSTTTVLPMQTPVYAAIGDFNLDNKLDIAVAGGGNGSRALIFYIGDGHGIFTLSSTSVPSLPSPHTMSAADLDNDGIEDLAILSRDGTVTIYLGSASGSFTLAKTLLLPQTAQSMDFADFDGDGILDMALGLADFNSVMVLRGLGGLEFTPFSEDLLPDDTVVQSLGSGVPRTEAFDDNTPATDIVRVNNETRTLEKADIADGATMETVPLALVQDPPTTVLLADMNNDGVPDAVVATHGRHGVGLQILSGNTSGGYDVPSPGIATCGNGILEPGEMCDILGATGCKGCVPQIGSTLVSIAAGDFDGDGNQDLVVVGAPGRLWLLSGNGNGQFSAVRMLGKTATKMPAVIGDFDGDGVLDIVGVLHQAGARGLTLLRNDGTGTFTNTAIPINATVKGQLLAADFDRNGAMDLAMGTSGHGGSGIALLFNDGSGAMPSTTTIPTAHGLQALSAADFNEDGWLDLLGSFGSGSKSTTMLYTGQPGGQFAPGVPAMDGGSTGSAKGAAATIVDVNDDSHQDVVVCRSAPATSCNPYFGTGTGSFLQSPPVDDTYIGRQLKTLAVTDLDGDGVLDFVGVSRRDNRIVVLFRDATMAVTSHLTLPTGGVKSHALAIGDLDGAFGPDLVVANEGTNDLTFFLNQGNRQFQTVGPVSLTPIGRVPSGVGLVDLDGDGKLDVVVSFQGTSNIGLFLIQDLAHLTEGGFVNVGSLKTGGMPIQMVLADINNDTIPDIITVNNGGVPPASDATPVPTPTPTATEAGAGQTPGPTSTPKPTATQTPGPTGSLTLYRSSAVGVYSRTDKSSGGTDPWAVAVADVNHDDAPDLLVINSQGLPNMGTLVMFLNDGAGNFTQGTVHRRGRKNPRDLCTGDFNGDGNTDVAVASTRTADILILFGNGDGTWNRHERVIPVGSAPRTVACEDVDGDGKTDVVFGRGNRGDIDIIQTAK